jgi:group I intron endonuclease
MQIYKVTNKINGKIYIGQTSKNDPNYLGSGPVIMKAVKKYGRDSFIREVIEFCDSKELLNEREIFWIKFYNSTDRNTGYNISTGGNGGNLGDLVNEKISRQSYDHMRGNALRKGKDPINKGVPMSEEQKDKLRKPKSENHKKNLSVAAMNRTKKKIICINNGLIYTMKDAANEFGLTIPNIVCVLKGRAEKTKGYSFRYL